MKRSQRAKIARPAGRPRRPSGRPRSQLPNGNGAPTIVGYRNGAPTIVGMIKRGELPGMEASCQLTLAKLPPAGGSSANRPTSAHHPQGDTMQKDLCTNAKLCKRRQRGHRIRERDLRPQRGIQRVSLPTSRKRLYPCAAAIAPPA